MGNGDCGQFILGCLCHSFLPKLLPCSSIASHPRETVFYQLHLCGFLPRASVTPEHFAPEWIHQEVTSPASTYALVCASLLMGPQTFKTCFSMECSMDCRWMSPPADLPVNPVSLCIALLKYSAKLIHNFRRVSTRNTKKSYFISYFAWKIKGIVYSLLLGFLTIL